jgi:hypothetical protein
LGRFFFTGHLGPARPPGLSISGEVFFLEVHTGNVQGVSSSGFGDREAGRALAWRGAFMPNVLALENNHWFGPEDIAALTTAFEAALGKLGRTCTKNSLRFEQASYRRRGGSY